MPTDWLIRGGRVIDPAQEFDDTADVRVRSGEIAEIGSALKVCHAEAVLDASGCIVAPGLTDLHVHLRDPGQTHKETIESGTRAAAAGGFVAVACMANTAPPIDSPDGVRYVLRTARDAGSADVHPIASISIGLEGRQPAPYAELLAAGARGFSDDGKSAMADDIMRTALAASSSTGAPVLVHSEDPALANGGVMHDGSVSATLGLPGLPSEAEERVMERDITLAEETGGRLHVLHVTTRGGVELVRAAKARGVDVTAEACPHHFTLTHEAVRVHGTNAKMNPPLRTAEDVSAVAQGFADGTLDVISTDHAPHTSDEKSRGMRDAPFGIIGMELCIPLVWTRLVLSRVLTEAQAIEKMTEAPRRVLGLPAPALTSGQPASIVVIDPDMQLEVSPACLRSRSANTPFMGERLRGWPVWTLWNGRETFRRPEATHRFPADVSESGSGA